MSITPGGIRSRSAGILDAIKKQLGMVNLKPVKQINVSFDPFHENAKCTRDFFYQITYPTAIATNLNCRIKPIILSDRSDPSVAFELVSGEKILVKTLNLNVLEILKICNKYITPLAPPDPEKEKLAAESKKKRKKKRISIKPGSKHRGVFL